jgi:pentatricopeptide repeat protein
MLRAGIRPFDFLAPSIAVHRSAGSFTYPFHSRRRLTHKRPSLLSFNTGEPELFQKVKEHITLLHYPDGKGPSDAEVNTFNQTVVLLQQALKNNQLPSVSEHWSGLSQRNLRCFLGPNQLDNFSKSIVGIWPTCSSGDAGDRRVIEEIALVAAAGRSTDALSAIMRSHIRKNDSNAVLELYRKYCALVEQNETWGDDDVADEENYEPLALISEHGGHHPGMAPILLAAVTAHAMTDSFQEAFRITLDAKARVSQFTVREYLKSLSHNPPLQQKVEDYVRKLNVARLIIRSPSLVKHITNLSRNSSTKQLEKFYAAVIDGLSGPEPYLTIHSTPKGSDKVPITDVAWSSFLSAFLKWHRLDLAEKLWDDLLKFGVPTGVSLWTALFDGYDGMGAVDRALNGWDAMLSQGVKPDALTYRALISTLFNGNKLDDAMKRFHYFEQELKGSLSPDPSQVSSVYNTVLHGLLQHLREKEAVSLFQAMKAKGPKPDVVSYNTFLRYYGKREDFRSIAAYVREMTSDGLVGDVFTFSTILSALLKVGRQDAPDIMLNLMAKQGIEPNVATFSAIIDQQLREQDNENFQGALRLLRNMEENPATQPNEVTYTAILNGIYRGEWLDPRAAEEYRMEIVERMRIRDIRPNRLTYQILLKGCLQYPEPEGLRNALSYYREMVRREIPLSQEIWCILLRGLVNRGEWEIASEMVKNMKRSGLRPQGAVLGLVETILNWEKQGG